MFGLTNQIYATENIGLLIGSCPCTESVMITAKKNYLTLTPVCLCKDLVYAGSLLVYDIGLLLLH